MAKDEYTVPVCCEDVSHFFLRAGVMDFFRLVEW